VPKISEERKTERREQILAGARRCFSEHSYEGATVTRLEQEIGLSRGAIFNYFGSKEDIFLELAWRDSERLLRRWLDEGWEHMLRAIVEEDPDWLGVYFELTRKARTDPEFSRRHEERTHAELAPMLLEHVRTEQALGALRDDVPAERIAGFVSLVANGAAFQMAYGEPIRNVDALVDLVRSAVEPPTG
jgi:TetR/AcrR family transcriptional regulator, transcriptional repressor of aconitase